jgi:arylsulfatase A-like enzyme
MDRRTFLSSLAGAGLAAAAPKQPPNIVILFADDLGYSDIGCVGGEIHTPNLDSLAKEGVRFTQFYNTARCCPSRATLLSGLYAHQAGVGHMVNPRSIPAYSGDLNTRCVTIAEALKPSGYETYISGKWHVTPFNDSKHNWPLQRGFDHYFGIIGGAGNYFDPNSLVRENQRIDRDSPDFYLTDAIGANAVRYIEQATSPFLLYTAFTSPHWPLHALEPDIARYRGRYRDGWDVLREQRRERMLRMGILDKRWPLTPRDSKVPAWAGAPDKEWQQRRMEVYAAQVDRMDQNVGRIIDALRKKGQLDNTLVVFLADNGGCAEELQSRGQDAYVASARKRGVNVETGNRPGLMPGSENTFASYGLPWANASNTPFRLYKHWVHEGGISTPFIARWPGGVRGHNTLTSQPAHLIDIMATCVDVAGARYPTTVQPMEGRSLLPAFQGRPIERSDALYWEHEGNRAIRDGNWKLVSRYPDQWELYDIPADRSELNNLASREPATVARLAALHEKWSTRVGVRPWPIVQKS